MEPVRRRSTAPSATPDRGSGPVGRSATSHGSGRRSTLAPLLLGLLGALLLTGAGYASDFTPFRAWRRIGFRRVEALATQPDLGILMGMVGVALLCLAWWWLRHLPGRRALAVTGVWAVPLFLCPPIKGVDQFAYLVQGWQLNAGQNPYLVTPLESGTALLEFMHPHWHGVTAVYPPLGLWVSAVVQRLGMGTSYDGIVDLLRATFALRALSVVCLLLVWFLVRSLARRFDVDPDRAAWLGLLSPVVLVHGVNGAHSDVWMLAVAVLALWVACRPVSGEAARWALLVPAAVLVGLATQVKQPAFWMGVGVALVPVAGAVAGTGVRALLVRLGRLVLAAALAAGTFVAVTEVSGLGYGWTGNAGLTGTAPNQSPAYVLQAIGGQLWAGLELGEFPAEEMALGLMVIGLVGLLALLAVWGVRRPMWVVAGGWLALSLTRNGIHGWYFLWPLVVAGLLPPAGRQGRRMTAMVVGAVTGLAIYDPLPMAPPVGVVTATIVGLLAWRAALGSSGAELDDQHRHRG